MITGEDEEDPSGNAGVGAQDDDEQKPAKAKPAKETAKRMVPTRTKQPQSGGPAQEAVVQPPPPAPLPAQATVAAGFDRSSPPPLDAYRQPTAIPPSSSPASVRTSSYPSSQGALTRSRSRASVSEKQIRRFAPPPPSQQQEPLTSDFTFAMPLPHNASSAPAGAATLRSSDFDLGNGNSDVTSALPTTTQSVLGSKRRHAAMVSEITNTQAGANSASPTSVTSPGGRRRRSFASSGGASRSLVINPDDMDVEEEPARKRVARR